MKSLAITLALFCALAFSFPVHLSGQDRPEKDLPFKKEEAAPALKDKNPRKPQPDQANQQQKPKGPPARPDRPESRENTRTWLGIMTAPVPQSLREHLQIEDGFGIQVHQVVDDSPAAKAGLRHHDILMRFNDQLLISPEHLSILVRREKPGNKAELTLIRAGKNETLNVTLGESEDVYSNPFPRHGQMDRLTPQAGGREGGYQHWRERHDQWRENRRPIPPQGRSGAPTTPVNPDISIEVKPPAVSVKPGFPVNIMGYHGVVKIDNDHGDVTIVRTDDDHTIKINDADGKSIYDGPYDPAKGNEGLPKLAREQLKKMKLDELKMLGPKPARPKSPGQDKKADREKEGTPL